VLITQAPKAFEERWANFIEVNLRTYENPIKKMSVAKRGFFFAAEKRSFSLLCRGGSEVTVLNILINTFAEKLVSTLMHTLSRYDCAFQVSYYNIKRRTTLY
jgi:hypothetical protein